MTAYAGRHRKTSAHQREIHRITASGTYAGAIGVDKDTFYVSLFDADTGNQLGINFTPRAVESLRRVLDEVAA